MTNDEIMAAFVQPPVFPADAIALAVERRGEIAPLLIAEIEDCASGRRERIEGYYYLTDIAIHLLAEWRDTRAFRPLLTLLGSPHAESLGDTITESLSSLLARTYNGDPAPLHALILDRSVDEFIREAVLDTYPMLVLDGTVTRGDAHAFLLDVFALFPHSSDAMWSSWVEVVSELQFEDLLPQVAQLFDDGAADLLYRDYDEYLVTFEDRRGKPYEPVQTAYRSPIMEMTDWHYGTWESGDPFGLDNLSEQEIDDLALAEFSDIPAVNQFRDVGRNDQCPCGSGRKFKKCCLPKVEAGVL